MKPVVIITLENEMDLVLIQKRCGKLGELLKLTISGRATFITAVTEICREVIEETDRGEVAFGIEYQDKKYSLVATINYPSEFASISSQNGIIYAKKLITYFDSYSSESLTTLVLRLSLPRSSLIDQQRISEITRYFAEEEPVNAYDEIKRKNFIQEEELKEWRHLNDQKSEFLSIASHELKTPLTTIKAYTQLALQTDPEACSEPVRKFLKKIESQTIKMNNLIQQLLDISKLESGVLTLSYDKVSMKEFIEDIVNVHTQVLPNHSLSLEVHEDHELTLDKLRIEQVISNIIMNAAKYSAAGSAIEVSVKFIDGEMQLEVKDQGIGMSVMAQQNAFQKFYREETVAAQYAGLGMGLYIASRIIAEHNGRMWINSTQGKGSSFYFSLPQEIKKQDIATEAINS
jgi:signal transduction histidine kinase